MRSVLFCWGMTVAAGLAGEQTVTIVDEAGRGLADAKVEAVLMPPDDPRLASVVMHAGKTDSQGNFRFTTDDRLILVRVKAALPGNHHADVDHRHGLGRPGNKSSLKLTLPKMTELVALHYREVRLTGLPRDRWVGFDAEVGDAIGPWGKGKVTDFSFHISYQQIGWTEPPETLAELRRTSDGARMDDQEWAETYGRFEGVLRLSFLKSGEGIRQTPAFWPYCQLKMPALAPLEGYESERSMAFGTTLDNQTTYDSTGYYLRLKTETGAGGKSAAAHYAKIHGRIEAGPGRVAFRFYYNPRAEDRRLAFAPGRNLLRPSGPKEPAHLFETQQP